MSQEGLKTVEMKDSEDKQAEGELDTKKEPSVKLQGLQTWR